MSQIGPSLHLVRRSEMSESGGNAEVAMAAVIPRTRNVDCALKKWLWAQSRWGRGRDKSNGTSIDCAITPVDSKSQCKVRIALRAGPSHRSGSRPISQTLRMAIELYDRRVGKRFGAGQIGFRNRRAS